MSDEINKLTQWLTLAECAREIRLSQRAFRRIVADRQIAVIEINTRVKRIERAELERFMDARRTDAVGAVQVQYSPVRERPKVAQNAKNPASILSRTK